MDEGLRVYPVVYTLRACEPLEWEGYAGSVLRGGLLDGLRQRFCLFPGAAQCDCPPADCPVAALVAPWSATHPRGGDVPRPLVLRPPVRLVRGQAGEPGSETEQATPVRLAPGDWFSFTILLIGRAVQRFPSLVLATRAMEQIGLGRPLRVNGGRRGRFAIERIEAVHLFSQQRALLYERGHPRVQRPAVEITAADVRERATRLSPHQLRLRFRTPTRLTDGGKLAHVPEPGILLRRLAERLETVNQLYGREFVSPAGTAEDKQEEPARTCWSADDVQPDAAYLASCQVTWVDTKSYSSRQQRSVPIGGFVGSATLQGKLSLALRHVLVWGEVLHVGKNTMKGDGWYTIET